MIALLLTICAVSYPSAQEEPAELLRLLAATQKKTASTYDKLSFDASVLTTNYIEKLGKPLTVKSHYTVVKRSDTTLITRELYTSTKNRPGAVRPPMKYLTNPVSSGC